MLIKILKCRYQFLLEYGHKSSVKCPSCSFSPNISLHSSLLGRRLIWAAVLYGLSVHMKIYPITYALPIALTLRTLKTTAEEEREGWHWRRAIGFIGSFLSRELFLFVTVSGGVFCMLTALFYHM